MNPNELYQANPFLTNGQMELKEPVLPTGQTETDQPMLSGLNVVNQQQPTVPSGAIVSSFETGFKRIEEKLQELQNLFEQRIQSDDAKDQAFDVLYDKMKQYESNYQASLKEGMIRSLVLLYDSIATTTTYLKQRQAPLEVMDRMHLLIKELLNILYSEDVELIAEEIGSRFDKNKQQAVRIVPTPDPHEDHLVVGIDKAGFLFRKKVLRPQSVVVRRYGVSAFQGK